MAGSARKESGVVHRDDIIRYTNDFLKLEDYPDYGPMGAQFLGKEEVTGLACGVSVGADLIKRAAADYNHPTASGDLLLVHHGLFWNNEPRDLDNRQGYRLAALEHYKITLCAYHLALDAHPEIGNNFQWTKRLGVTNPHSFAEIGFGGSLKSRMKVDQILKRGRLRREPTSQDEFNSRMETGEDPYSLVASDHKDLPPNLMVFPGGPERIKRIAVVTGGGARMIHQAAKEGYHLLFTGEAEEPTQALARELGIHVVCAGHHFTEQIGIQKLTEHVAQKFNLPWQYIDIPNPV